LHAHPSQVSLAEARKRREAAKALLREGKDPMVERRVEKLARAIAAGNTFAAIANELFAKMKREGCAETTLEKTTSFRLRLPEHGRAPHRRDQRRQSARRAAQGRSARPS
jgi:hypothetical protein